MALLVDYDAVIASFTRDGLVCLYPNSGAFGFPPDVPTHAIGWIGPPDATIRPVALPLTRGVSPPYEQTLTQLAIRAWRELFPSATAWVLPKAHWAYELMFGSPAWMPQVLRDAGLTDANVATLTQRHDGTAVAFEAGEHAAFGALAEGLLTHLLGSDYMLAFPGRPVTCTIHHHKQLWWTSPDAGLIESLSRMVPAP
jgi:hypothetical protein